MIASLLWFACSSPAPTVPTPAPAPAPAAPTPAPGPADERFTVTVSGQGPDVVLIPGLASSASVWDGLVPRLQRDHRVHVVQVAGFAGTPAGGNASGPVLQPLADDLAAYVEREHLAAPAIIGHSMGGLLGLMLAEQHPDDVGRLLVVDALPFYGLLSGPDMTVERFTPGAAKMRDSILAGGQDGFVAGEPGVMRRLVKSTGDAAQAAVQAAVASDHDVVARAMYDDATTDVRPGLGAIQAPVTLIYPWDETMGIPSQRTDQLYRAAYASLPSLKYVRIDGSYHFVMIDRPDAFLRAVDTFLR
jgi:pimeloyl-ACP methyl ester carboxylesterase